MQVSENYMNLELYRAASKLVKNVLNIKEGENVVIYTDTAGDMRVVKATAQAVYNVGAIPTIIQYETLPSPVMDPPKPVAAALKAADVLIEYAVAYILYSNTYKEAIEAGARYICLSGMDVDMLVRCIGKVDYEKMVELGEKLVELTKNAVGGRVTSPAGTDVTFKIDKSTVRQSGRPISKRGEVAMLGGQVSFAPIWGTVNGTIVFDGALWPPAELGLLKEPIHLKIKDSKIVEITGGAEAKIFEKWLKKLNDPHMYDIVHFSYGFNPGVRKPTGRIIEDERVFGCIEIGIGSYRGRPAKAHTDGIVLNPSIELDGNLIEENGEYVHPELAKLCEALGV